MNKDRPIPIYTLEGVRDADISTHWFTTEDKLGLSLLRFQRQPGKDVVVLIHGLTTSSDMFMMPEHNNLVNTLLDNGYGDVWALDYRMSNRHFYNTIPNEYSVDDVALYDHPAALRKIREVVGEDAAIHVICHCLGAMSFGMSLFAGLVGNIQSCTANAVFLTPYVPQWSRIKGLIFPFFIERVFQQPYVSPIWSDDPRWTIGRVIAKVVSLFHRECDVPACHMLSLMWGTGWPALYLHENMDEVTHRRGGDLFGGVGLNYHKHNLKMARKHLTVKMKPDDPRYAPLPDNYLPNAESVETPCLLIMGDSNRVFCDSNEHCFAELQWRVADRHRLHVFENYGHQDIFMGKHVDRDVFPTLLAFLNAHRVGEGAGTSRTHTA